jgi:hypothetical protein
MARYCLAILKSLPSLREKLSGASFHCGREPRWALPSARSLKLYLNDTEESDTEIASMPKVGVAVMVQVGGASRLSKSSVLLKEQFGGWRNPRASSA